MKDTKTTLREIITGAIMESNTEKTRAQYSYLLTLLTEAKLADRATNRITPDLLREFNVELLDSERKSGTIRTITATLSAVCRRAGIEYEKPKAREYKKAGKSHDWTEKQSLTAQQVANIANLGTLNGRNLSTSATEVRNAFVFSCNTGLRLSDLETITFDEITTDGESCFLRFKQTKTKENNEIPLNDFALAIVNNQRRLATNNRIFQLPKRRQSENLINSIGKAIGLDYSLTFHYARHTFASTLLNDGEVPVKVVSELMGHSNTQTTERYLHPDRRIKRSAVGKLTGIFL